MIDLVDIKEELNNIVKSIGFKIYGQEVKEGFDRPSFFMQLIPLESNLENRNTVENIIMVEIVYFSKDKTELENIKMYELLKSKIFPILKIKDRRLLVRNFRRERIDDILSIKFDLEFKTSSGLQVEFEKADTLVLEMEG